MATYASIQDLVLYSEAVMAPESGSAEELRLLRIIERAESQIDGIIMWRGPRDEANHRRVRVADLEPWDRECLKAATCAQAEYRVLMGEEFFASGQYARTIGPDFEVHGVMPVIGPRVWQELDGAGYHLFHRSGIGRHADYTGYYEDEFLWES